MSATSETPNTTLPSPLPDCSRMVKAIGSPVRWKMLQELSKGEPRTIGELASAAGCNYDNAGRHLIVLRKAGLVVQGRGRLYQIPETISFRHRPAARGLRPLPAADGCGGMMPAISKNTRPSPAPNWLR